MIFINLRAAVLSVCRRVQFGRGRDLTTGTLENNTLVLQARKIFHHRRLHGWPAMFQHRFGISHIHVGHRRYAAMEGGGRAMPEQLPRATQDDSMDGIGRVASGTKTEQLPRTQRAQRILC